MIAVVRATALLFTALYLAGCASREPAPSGSTALPDDIEVAFRNRWWHFYERGLAWADAGDDHAAEADLRQCLRLRQSDSRRARTYGLHFVQCFAQRELAAVLLRRGENGEAEELLRRSLDQEPSAKAELLLQRLLARPAAPASTVKAPGRIEISAVSGDRDRVAVSGQVVGDSATVLWLRDDAGGTQRIPADASGSFRIDAAASASLVLGDASGPLPGPLVPAAAPAAAPTLELDGPQDGQVVVDGRAWYRWQAAAAGGLAELAVDDEDGTALARLPLSGVRSGGTLRLDLASGPRRLRFAVRDRAGATALSLREVVAKPAAQQDRSLRAVALALPLLSPRRGGLRPADDPRLLAALLDDGRFRLIDQRADDILQRELALVEAGYIDRSTAAEAGRRLASRYVISGTLTRGANDAECYLRLIHSDSSAVVATADAYVEIGGDRAAEALFTAVAGRLRQTFPVIAGPVASSDGERLILPIGSQEGAVAHLRIHLFASEPVAEQTLRPSGEAEIDDVEANQARGQRLSGSAPASGWAVSE